MHKNLLVLSFDDINFVNDKILSQVNVAACFVYNADLLNKFINWIQPEALLIQAKCITDDIIEKILLAAKNSLFPLPWLCIIKENSVSSEHLARSNHVLYYGVGIDDVESVCEMIKYAVKLGYENSKKNSILFSTDI